ncbi:four-carbon acid sugar kinase family protein [uncultured Olsenella sp.]|uniref:four-carbon acid sugar kinase family protein n=1 Tax=uncultured Olsenella sp. TaxID=190764 RepID=UPI0026DD0482|nr:four-carbon acid sugar kinase family protein [uncultured Olsenella sp.]
MARLLIVSDDLTGAFDASVPFVGMGVDVVASPSSTRVGSLFGEGDGAVLAVNAASRHMSPLGAYLRVSSIVESACEAGVPILLKKTDSVLRGNVGAELSALWESTGRGCVHFVPAWPAMGRTTRGGIHLVGDVPVSESHFGRDPFEAVVSSHVRELLSGQSDAPLLEVAEDEPVLAGFRGIAIYDATSEGALQDRARELLSLGEERLALAGCAGLSHALACELAAACAPAPLLDLGTEPLLAFCGSVNQVTVGQCRRAREAGAPSFDLSVAQKLDPGWVEGPEGRDFVADVMRSWTESPLTVVDATSLDRADAGEAACQNRDRISQNLGRILARVCLGHPSGQVLAVGGDVLLALLDALGTERVRLLGEVARGVVASELHMREGVIHVLSKSGGFGGEDLLLELSGSHGVEGRV